MCIKKVFSDHPNNRKGIPFKEENYSNKLPEFYVIDIKINDSTGNIENIDCFRKNSSVHYKGISQAVLKIKKDWKLLHCGSKRLLIPVFIFFESDEDFSEYPFDIQNDKVHGVFVSKIINVFVPSNKRYK